MRVLKGIIKDIGFGIGLIIYRVSGLFKRKDNIWVFGAWNGMQYSDNSKYMFEYINKHHPEILSIWITKNKSVIPQIEAKGYRVYYIYSLKGIKTCLCAAVAFFTEGSHDISELLLWGAKKIQLWHGMGIKDVAKFVVTEKFPLKSVYVKLIRSHRDEYWMVACNDAKKKYSEAYGVEKNRMYITGQPKDDTFINQEKNRFIEQIKKNNPESKIYVYLPTHRNFGQHNSQSILSIETLKKVNEELKKNNLVIIFKPHAHEFKNYKDNNLKFSNIIFATDPEIFSDVYEFLPECDGLITDYSGIMLGYLTSGKPIIYFAYDKEQYVDKDAGFYYTYEDILAGPLCYTWSEVIESMIEFENSDNYLNIRKKMQKKFSPFNDGKNCERVYQKVIDILKEEKD